MQYQLFTVLLPLVLCQSEDETAFHFSDVPHGRIVWIIENTNSPWIGEYKYVKSQTTPQTVLLTVVDSSSGNTLGECTDFDEDDIFLYNGTWNTVQWMLTPNGLSCTVSQRNSSRIIFPLSTSPRTFSVRLQSNCSTIVNGPACVQDVQVQNERAVGCPPHLHDNFFSSSYLRCGCPLDSQNQGASRNPHLRLFELASTVAQLPPETLWTVSPCAEFLCQNNGTCVVTQEGSVRSITAVAISIFTCGATWLALFSLPFVVTCRPGILTLPIGKWLVYCKAACLCRNGFIGANCEVDVCSKVPCQNGGSCRANGGEAICECLSPFTGILCESVIATCEPTCENGECVVQRDKVTCECRQGFTGSACNVVDVCLRDTACSIFGEEAKCVIDENSFIPVSSSLFNASYECQCPHPVDGEYVDCLALHLSTSVSGSIPTITPDVPLSITRIQETTRKIQKTATLLPLGPASTSERQRVTGPVGTTLTHRPIEMSTSLAFEAALPRVVKKSMLHLAHTLGVVSSGNASLGAHCLKLQVDCVVVTKVPSTTSTVSKHSFTTELPTIWTTHLLNTKAGAINGSTSARAEVQNSNNSQVLVPSMTLSTLRETISTNSFPDRDMRELLSTKELTTTEAEIVSPLPIKTTTVYEITSSFTSLIPDNITLLFNHLLDLNSKPTTHLPNKTNKTTMPLWTPETEPSSFVPTEITTVMELNFETSTSIAVKESEQNDVLTANVTNTTIVDVGAQKSSAISWIVAIVAIIVLALLLLATLLFILRYVKQSRKLHGKYNPAREEHALSAAFSMPMSHMSKDERLI